ncbi:hypothetical protein VVD49_16200 [Uliginosibacterium sp. H3]|uniref:ABC-type transport auxiliary lipoprotein component domain-containing protein n=1 Tax=Uliginosibacterium silvisoli TaxID=3114758 RepID=A0ABU6K5U3_9RHOO|nr:hypothetical protein [Uliginosibacterium sp. H3]
MMRELMKSLFVLVFIVFGVLGCVSKPIVGVSEITAPLPEPVGGLNFFVYVSAVPTAAADRAKFILPDPLKVNLAETDTDDRDTASRLSPFLTALREHIHLPFRNAGIPVQSYVAGGRYTWDELRRDRRNYRLVVWANLIQVTGQPDQADLWFVLQNENSGRRVWTRVVKNAFAVPLAQGDDAINAKRIAVAEVLASDTMQAMRNDGITLPIH